MMGLGSSKGEGGVEGARPSSMIGRVVGDFRILRQIGKGGMGTVYEARQLSLDRIVALKVLSHTASLPESAILRFKREAQASAKLHHPHIVSIYAQDEADGVYHYAMELVTGSTVHQVISSLYEEARTRAGGSGSGVGRTAEAADETVLLSAPAGDDDSYDGPGTDGEARSIARALHREQSDFDVIARHAANVADALEYAHQNGVIHRDIKPHNLMLSRGGRICVSDFGLARMLEQPGVTVTGEFIGSPLYMSPEQITRGQLRVDHRTDIYSLGATLYEWLALVPPYPGDSREQVITRIITSDAPGPRMHDPRIPVDLETICMKALEKDANRRYQSAGEMRDDLQRYLERRTIKARRAGPLSRFKKFVLRNPVPSMAVLAAAIVVSLGFALWQQRAISRSQRVQHDVEREQHTAEIAAVEQQKLELEEQRLALLEALAPKAAEILGPLLATGSDADREARIEAARHFASALLADYLHNERDRLGALEPGDSSDVELEHYVGALASLASQNIAGARELLARGVELNPDDLHARTLKAIVHFRLGQFQEMLAEAERIVTTHVDSAEGYFLRGAARLFLQQPVTALQDVERARERNGDSAWLHALSGLCRFELRRFSAAETDFDNAIERNEELTFAWIGRARSRYEQRKYDDAIADVTHVIEAEPENARAYVLRGECYDMKEDYDRSIADYQKASTLERGSTWIAYKILRAQATKQRKEQASSARTDGADHVGDSSRSPAPHDKEADAEWFDRFLRERLRSAVESGDMIVS